MFAVLPRGCKDVGRRDDLAKVASHIRSFVFAFDHCDTLPFVVAVGHCETLPFVVAGDRPGRLGRRWEAWPGWIEKNLCDATVLGRVQLRLL